MNMAIQKDMTSAEGVLWDRFSNKSIYWETDPFYGPVKKNSFSLVDNILVTEEKYQEYWI